MRSPLVEVPIGTYGFTRDERGMSRFTYQPFSDAKLKSLYSSDRDYTDKVRRQLEALVRTHLLLREDAQQFETEAEHADRSPIIK